MLGSNGEVKIYNSKGEEVPSVVLTPEIVRKFCRFLGGSTNGQASDVEDACARFLAGEGDADQLIATIREELYNNES